MRPVSDVKQKLLEKLRQIARKKELARNGRFKRRPKRRFDKPSSRLFSFPKDKYEALQEVQRILGFTDEELRMFFALLEKANGGDLEFEIGDISVEFRTYSCDDNCLNEIEVVVKVEEKEVTHTVEYSFDYGLRNIFAKWQKKL